MDVMTAKRYDLHAYVASIMGVVHEVCRSETRRNQFVNGARIPNLYQGLHSTTLYHGVEARRLPADLGLPTPLSRCCPFSFAGSPGSDSIGVTLESPKDPMHSSPRLTCPM